MRVSQIKVWHTRFRDGRESVESDPISGQSMVPATSRISENGKCVRSAINKDRRLIVRELEKDLGIP